MQSTCTILRENLEKIRSLLIFGCGTKENNFCIVIGLEKYVFIVLHTNVLLIFVHFYEV